MFSLACKSLSFRQIDPKARVPLAQACNRLKAGDHLGAANRLRIAYYRTAIAACQSRGCKPKGKSPSYVKMVTALLNGKFISAGDAIEMRDYWRTIHKVTHEGVAREWGTKLAIEFGYEMLDWFPELRPGAKVTSVRKGVAQ